LQCCNAVHWHSPGPDPISLAIRYDVEHVRLVLNR